MNAPQRWFHPLAIATLAMLIGSVASPALAATAKPRAIASGAPKARTARPQVLPFIADDYAKALAEARVRKVPIFIEAWAPW